jgi:hypothetical protein
MPEIQSIIRLLGENEGGQVKKALPCSFLRYPVAAYGQAKAESRSSRRQPAIKAVLE